MKLNNSQNIIVDADITMTGQHLGETLDVVLDSQSKDITELKRNVKFLYQYGGVGSHGGGSGSSSDEWSIYATLNRTQINNNIINLNGASSYNLQIRILKPNGISYRVTYSYRNSRGQQQSSPVVLSMDNAYLLSTNINLDINDSIVVEVMSENGDVKQVNAEFITNPYSFKVYFGDENGNKFNVDNNDLFINDLRNSGIYAYIEYDIGIQGDVFYSYNWFDGTQSEGQIDLSQSRVGKLKLDITPEAFLTDVNQGFYSILVKIRVEPTTQQSVELPYVISCNLIPNSLYLKILPAEEGALLYDDQDVIDPYYFGLGNIVFNLQVYDGVDDGQRGYYIDTVIRNMKDNSEISYDRIYVEKERDYSISKYMISDPGCNRITFTLGHSGTGREYHISKYFFIKASQSNIDWSYFHTSDPSYIEYCINSNGGTRTFDSVFSSNHLFIQTESNAAKSIYIPNSKNFISQDCMINFTVSYNSINDIDKPILLITNNNSPITNLSDDSISQVIEYANTISVYQNKIRFDSKDLEIYIPKYDSLDPSNPSQYHVVTIYRKFHKKVQNSYRYEILVYIDGSLETALPEFYSSSIFYDNIIFNKGNYNMNLFDIKYYSPLSSEQKPVWNDADIARYFYTYAYMYGLTIDNFETLVSINNYVTQGFHIDTPSIKNPDVNTKMVSVDIQELQNLATIPEMSNMILFDIEDTAEFTDADANVTNNFLKWYQFTIDENQEDDTGRKEVKVSYKEKGSVGFKEIITVDSKFYIEKQGTSTKNFFSKNLDLISESTDPTKTSLFSPNFELTLDTDSDEEKKRKSNTFLPESVFTLKKDVVDSAHSNNNSIADFVNSNTTKFATGEKDHKYYPYIKNCLTGFPCLVFVRVSYDYNGTKYQPIYFLGYYNFNLGRKSYYNLGYYSLRNLDNIYNVTDDKTGLSNGFKVYSLSSDINTIKDGVIVTEIQNNNPYYDFSQYHSSILFGANDKDIFHMFGDYVFSPNLRDRYQNLIQNFVKNICLSGGYIFEYLKKNFGPQLDEYKKTIEKDGKVMSYNQVPNYKTQYKRVFNNQYEYQIDEELPPQTNNGTLVKTILGDEEQEILPLLDYQSLVEYYTIIMAFGMLDSIEKNMNIKSWNSGQTFSLAFYDMDTALGLDNGGQYIEYYAFSDYFDLLNDSTTLEQAVIYRDFFSPSSTYKGFDTPSSYLLAIAKYSALILGSDIIGNFPLRFWARLRRTELQNAHTFIQKYYSNRTDEVGISLMNYNYRATYFQKSDNGYMGDFNRFHGNRKYYTENWLKERLHILDVYMGLMSTENYRYIQYLDENNDWKSLAINGVPVREVGITSTEKGLDNSDIIIYKDIFINKDSSSQTNAGNKYSNNIITTIKALENSFIVINIPGKEPEQYMIKDPTKEYELTVNVYGSNNVLFGGSDRWTYISDVAPFVQSQNLYINSTLLQNLYISSNVFTTLNSISGYLPAVRDIKVEGKKNVFNLVINNSNSDNMFPNVQSIDLTSSSVNLKINNSRVTSIIANNMNAAELSIINCSYINNLEIDNSTFTSSISISPLPSTISNFVLDNVKAKTINITSENENATITISNNSLLENVTLTGFKKVVLQTCPKLKSVTLGNTTEELQITTCSRNSTTLKINESDDWDIDLSGLTNLKSVCFATNGSNYTANIKRVKLPDGCKLPAYAFYGTSITEISSTGLVYLLSAPSSTTYVSYIFYNTPLTTGLQYLRINNDCKSLAGIFGRSSSGGGLLTLQEVSTFLNNIPPNNNVVSISGMFFGQTSLIYNKEDNFNEYKNETCSLSLAKFTKVNSIASVFSHTGVTFFNKYIFTNQDNTSYVGKDYNGDINVYAALTPTTNPNILYCTIDSLSGIIGKISILDMFVTFNSADTTLKDGTTKLQLIDSNGDTYSETAAKTINIKQFFNGGINKIKKIFSVQFTQYHNFHALFYDINSLQTTNPTTDWTQLTLLANCFDKVISLSNNIQEGFEAIGLQSTNINYLYQCFNEISSNTFINLFSNIPWSKFKISSLNGNNNNTINDHFSVGKYRTDGQKILLYDCFQFNADKNKICKYITQENYNSLWTNYINQSSYYTKLGNIFENTLLISSNPEGYNLPAKTTRITELYNTFSKAKITAQTITSEEAFSSLSDSDFIPIKLDNIIANMPSCIVFDHAFQYLTLSNALPMNFFKRRKQIQTNVYKATEDGPVIVNDELQPIRLITYTYDQNIKNLSYCFYNTEIKSEENPFFNVTNINIDSNHLETMDGTRLQDEYYVVDIISSPTKVQLNPELADCNGVIVHYDVGIINDLDPKVPNWQNSIIYGLHDLEQSNILFVAPDILYGCLKNCNISYCFAESNFSGAIPKHIFQRVENGVTKGFEQAANIENWIYRVNILPQRYSEQPDYTESDLNINSRSKINYVYIPDNFNTKITSYKNAFNFYLRLPPKFATDDTIIAYYLFSNLAFGTQTKPELDTCLPIIPLPYSDKSTNTTYNGYTIYNYDFCNPGNIYYNIMYNSDGVDGYSLASGINVSNMFDETYTRLGFGRLFKNLNTSFNSYRLNSKKESGQTTYTPCIRFNSNRRASWIIFPNATAALNNYISASGGSGNPTSKIQESLIKASNTNYYKVNNSIELV